MKTEMISCMNNTKWREFFEAVEKEPTLSDIPFFIKYLDNTDIFEETLFLAEITDVGLFAYWSSLIDRRETEKGNCWLAYADIEWISLPNIYDPNIYAVQKRDRKLLEIDNHAVGKHIIALKSIIDELGQLTYKLDENELKLYGYKWRWQYIG